MSLRKRHVALLLTLPLTLAFSACADDGGDGGQGNGGNGGNQQEGGDGANEERFTSDLQLGTGTAVDIDLPLGDEYAGVLEENVETDDVTVEPVETGSSTENIAGVEVGSLQLGVAESHAAAEAVAGEGAFKGVPVENVGFMGQLYPEAVHVIAPADSDIESVADLEGRMISVGPPGSGARTLAQQVLTAHGLEEGDYETLEPEGDEVPDAVAALSDGTIEAAIEVVSVPSESLGELGQDTKLIPVDAEAIQTIVSELGGDEFEIPADAYDFASEPVATVSIFAGLYGSTAEISEELGYEITKTVYENADAVEGGDVVDVEQALQGRGDLPLHPGAERYFQEEGLL